MTIKMNLLDALEGRQQVTTLRVQLAQTRAELDQVIAENTELKTKLEAITSTKTKDSKKSKKKASTKQKE